MGKGGTLMDRESADRIGAAADRDPENTNSDKRVR